VKLTLQVIAPETAHGYFGALRSYLEQLNSSDAVLRAGFAYVTLGGVQSLLSHLRSVPCWDLLAKEFVVGIHHAITEPSALDALRSIQNTQIRIYLPGRTLTAHSIGDIPTFHPKFLTVTNKRADKLNFLVAGSANLTSFAVGYQPRNYELGVSLSAVAEESVGDGSTFRQWWMPLWKSARLLDDNLLSKYAEIRRLSLEKNPLLQLASEVPPSIATARHFFIEAGAASGPPGQRHQIEFSEALARFFGPTKQHRVDLTLFASGNSWRGRPLSFKKTTYGVPIWRLGMPTQASGGEPIAERAVKFTRTSRASEFEIEVADCGDAQFRRWIKAANSTGHLGATRGGRSRRFGFY
jgi:hypothetical protein